MFKKVLGAGDAQDGHSHAPGWARKGSCGRYPRGMLQEGGDHSREEQWTRWGWSSVGTQNWNAKGSSNYHTVALISHASKIMLKILQARLQQYMN